jgi:hypothetical protein
MAQSPPHMVGKWKGISTGIGVGRLKHLEPSNTVAKYQLEFPLAIKSQEGRIFSGSTISAHYTEPLIGFIDEDNRSLFMVEKDGIVFGTIINPDQIHLGYLEVTPHSKAASFGTYEREK